MSHFSSSSEAVSPAGGRGNLGTAREECSDDEIREFFCNQIIIYISLVNIRTILTF